MQTLAGEIQAAGGIVTAQDLLSAQPVVTQPITAQVQNAKPMLPLKYMCKYCIHQCLPPKYDAELSCRVMPANAEMDGLGVHCLCSSCYVEDQVVCSNSIELCSHPLSMVTPAHLCTFCIMETQGPWPLHLSCNLGHCKMWVFLWSRALLALSMM